MPYLIDGHNLIPHIRGLSLDQIDDELALIEILERYFKHKRKKAVVYFDHAQAGGSTDIQGAFLRVHFVRPPAIADGAIVQHLKKLGGATKNWVVVSSDHYVQKEAARAGAQVVTSATFAALLETKSEQQKEQQSKGEDDINQWLKIFGKNS